MSQSRKEYEGWRQRFRAIDATVTSHYRDWIGAAVALAADVDRDCHDPYVTGHARTALKHAQMFQKAKQAANVDRKFRQFRSSWDGFGGAIDFHLRDDATSA